MYRVIKNECQEKSKAFTLTQSHPRGSSRFRAPSGSRAGRDAVLLQQESLQRTWQRARDFLPREHLQTNPQLHRLHAKQHRVPLLAQVRAPHIAKDGEGVAAGVRGQHVADELISAVAVSITRQHTALKDRGEIAIAFDHGAIAALEVWL